MIKIFRRVTDGPHPEAEMGRYLTEQTYANTAPLLGEMVRVDRDGTRHALAIAQGFIRNQGDAWTWTLDLLIRGLSDLVGGDEAAAAAAEHHEDYRSFAALLGQRVGELHMVLARPSDDPAFDPVALDAACTETWAIAAQAQFEAALSAISAAPAEAVMDEHDVGALLARRRDGLEALARLGAGRLDGLRTRIHGDLHLGQVLVANGDLFVIDFEGEPAKPVESRRAKGSRWRDVAGVLRSFDYAAAVVKRKSTASHAHLPAARVDAFLATFARQAGEVFLDAYRAATETYPVKGDDDLLKLFLVEKAAYEITYEAANRPGWMDVPVHGLAQLLETICEEHTAA
jgi:maltose alpha-D-glucosyltransferase/alpha-amylase